jgi:hypothetical protein
MKMRLKQFKTHKPLWLWVSLVLFVPPWFVGGVGKYEDMPAAGLWLVLFSNPVNLGAALSRLFVCTLFFGIPALVIGWVIHCLIIVVRDFFTEGNRAQPNP